MILSCVISLLLTLKQRIVQGLELLISCRGVAMKVEAGIGAYSTQFVELTLKVMYNHGGYSNYKQEKHK